MRTMGGEPTVRCRSLASRSRTSRRTSTRSIVTSSSRDCRVSDDHAGDLLHGGHAQEYFVDAVFAQGLHPLCRSHARDLIGALALDGEPADRLAHDHDLVEAEPPLIARSIASRAAFRAVQD